MKKLLIVLIAVVMALTFVTVAACSDDVKTVIVTLHISDDDTPVIRRHVVGEDDLPTYTKENMEFRGWYYDKNTLTVPFDKDKEEDRQVVYAKWEPVGSTTVETVNLILSPNYVNAQLQVETINKGSTFNLPTPVHPDGYTFDGWYTQLEGGTKWTNTTPINSNTTLYAHWTQGSNPNPTPTPTPADISSVLNKYGDTSNWNFADTVTIVDSEGSYDDYYEYLGDYVLNSFDGLTHYYDMSDYSVWYLYYDNGDGTYTKYDDTTDEFSDGLAYDGYSYSSIVDLYTISDYTFVTANGYYSAQNPADVGNAVLGDYGDGYSWTLFNLYISNGNITKIVAKLSDGTTYTHTFSKFGSVSFTLPDAEEGGNGGSGSELDPLPTEPTGTMDNQVYDENTFDGKNLQGKIEASEDAIGLPSTGTYNALVIPVQFKNDNITTEQLAKLEKAFNGDVTSTGWESVKSYYEKSSYGNLKLTFDITSVFQASNTADYYANKVEQVEFEDGVWSKDGSAFILEEALNWCVKEKGIDLTQYDTNNDGYIDAVYLIYSADVDYDSDDSFYWAYVTWYYDEQQFNGLDAYYYLFAGFDFMDENLDKLNGVTVNAETYIHETGHLLGLDDYYDYDESAGGNLGLGGADMMDYNVGDHGVYSKIMLGWLDPTIVTTTQTITIKSSQAQGDAILIPLNWNNSYFCEYLLIDLYSAEGLNAMGASMDESILYDGAEYGVRIYHVAAWVNDPYNNSFGSFTDYNNSISNIPLIKLVEADGKTSESTEGSWASESDLWQAGQNFNTVFPQYMRYDGKLVNFNITIDSVSAEEATITITYAA